MIPKVLIVKQISNIIEFKEKYLGAEITNTTKKDMVSDLNNIENKTGQSFTHNINELGLFKQDGINILINEVIIK